MLAALGVLLAVVIGFVVFRSAVRGNQDTPLETVDYAASLPFWRSEAKFALLAPPTLPAGWRATSADFVDTRQQSWHLGVLTDQGHYVGIEQASDSIDEMVREFVDSDAERGGQTQIGGHSWTEYSDRGGDHALVRRAAGVTTVVVGSLPQDQLVQYVASLR
jgi:hypothetical protein